MNIHTPLTRLLLLLAIFLPLFSQTLKAQEIEISGWTAAGGTNNLNGSLSGSFSAVNTDTNRVPWRVLLEGNDIYGNRVAVPIASGSLDPLLGVTVTTTAGVSTTNKAPVAQTFSGTIPNDGTLYQISESGSGYRLNLYTGTNVTALTPGVAQAGSDGFFIDVIPDLAIPPVTQITKIRATATPTVVGGEVTALTPNNPGQGYDPFYPPTVTIRGTGGSGAAATAVVDPTTGSILSFDMTSKGTGYPTSTTVTVANPPSTQTQRTGGVLYGYNEQTGKFNYVYNSGDTVRYQTTILNNRTGDGGLQSRPMRSTAGDRFRLRTVLTVDPAYTGTAGDDDLLVYDQACLGDMAGFPEELSEIRSVRTYYTLGAVPVYGVPVTGSPAPTATAEISGGRVTNILIATNATQYNPSNPPPVTIATNAGGSGATAVAQLNTGGVITNIVVVSPGAGYTNAPAVTIAPPAYGARYYQPMPDDGVLDIGEQIELGYDVLMPQRYPGIFFVAAKVDALNEIDEPIGFRPGRESPPLDPEALVNNNTFISDVATRVQILSGPGPGVAPVSQVTDSSGVPLIQSDGYSDMASVSEDGGYVAFESYARDLAVSPSAATALQPTLTGFPPLYSQLPENVQSDLASGLANGNKQIFRRNTSTKEIDVISVSSSGAQAAGNAQNAAINNDGRQIAFESRAANLVPNDTGGSSDIFVRRLDLLRTIRVSVNASGVQGNAGSFTPSISGDGRYVAFASVATNLDPSNPKQNGAGNQQIFVHDRDVSGSGTYDSVGNVRTYMVSVTPVESSQATASATITGGKMTRLTVVGGGSGYSSAAPPSVLLTGGGGYGATATANVVGGEVVSFNIVSSGAGYTSAPTVTITPRANAANGWSETPKISEDGKYLTFVSYSSNLPKVGGGPAIGDMGWQGVVYRVELFQGSPVVNTMEAVSVDTAGNLANALSYESVINGDGSQVAFTSLADNLVDDDTNAFADVFVRDFSNGKTVRVSESLNRFAIGTIRFPALPTLPATPPDNNLRDGDSFILRDGTNEQTLTFRLVPAGANEVLIGATASASRENLVRAINALQASDPPRLNILAIADSPASPNTFYPPTSRVPGQAYYPGLFLLASVNGSEANLEITGSFDVLDSTDGVNTGQFAGGNLVETTGMRLGGTQADDDAGEIDGVPGGSTMPSIDRSGMVVAFRSTMQTLDVFSRTYNGLNGLRPGDLMRMLRNASGNAYVRIRDVDGSGDKFPDALDNVDTKRISVNNFGYATYGLADVPSSANSHKPAVSALGRFIAFSSDAENNGGLAFGRTNLDPQDNNGFRDVYLYDRDVTAEPPTIIVNNPPDVTLTEPSWLSGRSLSVGSTITLNALVTDTDEELDIENVIFFVNGTQIPAQTRYGNYFSTTVKINTISASNIIQARARDNSGASNDSTTSAPITFSSENGIAQPTNITMLPLPRGTILEVGQPVELTARVTLPLGSALWNVAFVRFYANGVLVGSDGPYAAGVSNAVATVSWYPSDSGPVVLQAIASTADFFFATENPRTFANLYSNQLPSVTVLGVDEAAPTGTPQEVVVSLFQTVLSRPPTGVESTYWVDALSTGAVTPSGMVLQLVAETEYNDLQNTLFGYYYRLNTTPSSTTYLRNLNAMETDVAPLPAGSQPSAANGTIASPYGATDGDASAAQFIIGSADFATANPGVQTMTDNAYLTWYYNRWGGQLGNPIALATAMTAYAPLAENKGYATALISALYYAARDQTAFNYQLKATSLRWLFTGVWSAPTSPAVTTQSQFETFVNDLVDSTLGVSTWSWVYANGLTDGNAEAEADPAGDGINNLKKYAFNMDPNWAYSGVDSILTPTGASGLPLVTMVADGGNEYLQITYVRRINENSVSYTPQFISSLTDPLGWQSATEEPVSTKIDSLWERVTVRDSLPQSAVRSRFGRLKVATYYWMPQP